jgi:iron complex transport system substrate-binding protein
MIMVCPVRLASPGLSAEGPAHTSSIGLPLVDVPEGEVPTFAELSPEQVTQADADILLYSSFGTGEESGAEEVLGGPLWSRLTAVQDGRAYEVEDDVFYTGIGPLAATLMVERLSDTLT